MSWPLVKLGVVCKFVRGPFGGALKKECFVKDGYAVYEQQHAIYNQFSNIRYFVDENKFNELKRFKLNPGDLIMSCSGTMGKIAIVPETIKTGIINQALLKLTPSSKLDLNYLKYWLESKSFQFTLNENTHGAAIKNVASVSVLKEIEILLPPLAEQKRIAATLDKADAIRRKRQQAIKLADDFLRSVFLDMFGDPMVNPKGWPIQPWSQVLKIINGKNQKAVQDENGQYPIMGSGGEMARANDYLSPENSVIIGRKGNINKPILVKEKYWNVDTAFGLVPDRNKISHNYLYWFCKLFNFEKLNKTVTIPSLTKADLLEIKIPIPDQVLLQKFDALVEKLEAIHELKLNSEKEALNAFNSLSKKAFAGEL